MPDKVKILVIVEGAKTDLRLMKRLFEVYNISQKHEIVSYNTNIYTLYNEMFADGDPDSIDLLQHLKSREINEEERKKFDEAYSDILLIFDLEAHAPDFKPEKILEMAEYFNESSDMGKLYINYPMVEAFYHMKSIPDDEFMMYSVSLTDIPQYKSLVNRINRDHDYRKFAVDKDECNIIINQNIEKAWMLAGADPCDKIVPDGIDILNGQLNLIAGHSKVLVLCTCAFYIAEYNPKLIQ